MENMDNPGNFGYRSSLQGTISPDMSDLAGNDIFPSTFSRYLVEAFGCPCLEFHRADSMRSIIRTYQVYQEFGKCDGFLPLLMRSELPYGVKQDGVPEEERKTPAEAGKEASSLDISAWIKNELGKYSDEELADNKRNVGLRSPIEGKYDFTSLLSGLLFGYYPPESEKPCDSENIILVCIPETNPWMLPFWITPCGGGFAPSMVEQMAFFRRWHALYGATPATVSDDFWSLIVDRPPETFAAAEALAWEHFAFCPDSMDEMGFGTIRALAEQLIGATAWHFWWD